MNNGKICVSVCARTVDKLIDKFRQSEAFADVIELRFDCLDRSEFDWENAAAARAVMSRIFALRNKIPWVATFRPKVQGGNRELSPDERNSFWNSGFETEFNDLEEDVFATSSSRTAKKSICSYHDFSGGPSDVAAIYERLAATGADIIKIAISTNDITDTIGIWDILIRAKAEDRQIIPIAMGDAGKLTRILGLAHGAFMTYASIETGNETAPGQVTARDLVEVYRVIDLDENTQVFGVIGDPISQSISPYMHNPAFAAIGLNAVFVPLLVKDIGEFIRRMVKPETREVELNFGGFSVTMPHKQTIIPHLDAIDPVAAAIGAVNTVKIENGKLTGYNTDAHGFITPLKAKYGNLRDARVAVIGAGGAARAVVYALKQENVAVTVFARDENKAEAFADEFGVSFGNLSELTSEFSNFKSAISNSDFPRPESEISNFKFQILNLHPHTDPKISNSKSQISDADPHPDPKISNFKSQISDIQDQRSKTEDQRSNISLHFDILVDATPTGMKGPFENESLFTADQLNGLKFVYDLVTKPTDTPILREARSVGIPTLGGIEMLVAQGVRQFEIWTSREAPLDIMRAAVKERMEQLQK